ncbi:thiomuracin/GE37468 family thiazolyl RiPP peptide, partial [Nonomuraea fuscirosea]|uniref:thiomuracin/GE37468 family thiazolyl RiPP peptide n=1 Tax=Nonomuraea fuscirosea TaxID=1291556 RepID=UPI003439C1D8
MEAPFSGDGTAEYVGTALFTPFIARVAAAMLPVALTGGHGMLEHGASRNCGCSCQIIGCSCCSGS